MNRNIWKMTKTERKNKILNDMNNMLKDHGLTLDRNLTGKQLVKGMKVAAYYDASSFGFGCDTVEILGVTGDDQQYGKGGVKFDSVEAALKYYNCKTFEMLEATQNEHEYGYHSYLYARDLFKTNDLDEYNEGPWYYLYNGRWSCGSGAVPLSFIEIITLEEEAKRAESRIEVRRLLDEKINRNNVRKNIARLARLIIDSVSNHPEITSSKDLSELVSLDSHYNLEK